MPNEITDVEAQRAFDGRVDDISAREARLAELVQIWWHAETTGSWEKADAIQAWAPATSPDTAQAERSANHDLLLQFAERVDDKPRAVEYFRRVAAAWPEQARQPACSFTVHQALEAQPDRFELLARLVQVHPRVTLAIARQAVAARRAEVEVATEPEADATEAERASVLDHLFRSTEDLVAWVTVARSAGDILKLEALLDKADRLAGTTRTYPDPLVDDTFDTLDDDGREARAARRAEVLA